jgi:transcriptional regulator with XRE-family HTH domain
MSDLKKILAEEFADKKYAHGYMHQNLLERFATQLYTLRTTRNLSQEDLAKVSGVPQGKISRLERAEVPSFTLATALKLADALDVGVRLGFEPFSEVIRSVERSAPADLQVQSRTGDLHSMRSVNTLLDDMNVGMILVTTKTSLDVRMPESSQ